MANHINRLELLDEAIKANDEFKKWRIDNNVVKRHYRRDVIAGKLPPMPKISDKLATMIWQMAEMIIFSKHFARNSADWKDELRGEISEIIIQCAAKFDVSKKPEMTREELAKGCFNYYTQSIHHGFYKVIIELNKMKDLENEMTGFDRESKQHLKIDESVYYTSSPEEMMIDGVEQEERYYSEMTPEQNRKRIEKGDERDKNKSDIQSHRHFKTSGGEYDKSMDERKEFLIEENAIRYKNITNTLKNYLTEIKELVVMQNKALNKLGKLGIDHRDIIKENTKIRAEMRRELAKSGYKGYYITANLRINCMMCDKQTDGERWCDECYKKAVERYDRRECMLCGVPHAKSRHHRKFCDECRKVIDIKQARMQMRKIRERRKIFKET